MTEWTQFKNKVDTLIKTHPIVSNNKFTSYFEKGEFSEKELRHFIVQFSVFSNLFLQAQLNKVINAQTFQEAREGKEILLNELGVLFNGKGTKGEKETSSVELNETTNMETTGSVQEGVYKFEAAHFEWLLKVGAAVGLSFGDMGKRKHGTEQTLYFTDTLYKLYGSDNDVVSIAASYAIENWAAAGFWDELTNGFRNYNKNNNVKIPLGFWIFHSKIEQNHADHTADELKEVFDEGRIEDFELFQTTIVEMLDALEVFWVGLFAETPLEIWTSDISKKLMRKVMLKMGTADVDQHYCQWMRAWKEIVTNENKKKI